MNYHKYDFDEFLRRFLDPDKEELFEIIKILPPLSENGPWLAGGAIRRILIKQSLDSDFDLFFKDDTQLKEAKNFIEDRGGWLIHENDHQITYGAKYNHENIKIQLIKIAYYESCEMVIDSFDFTITQFGFDGKNLICGEFSLWDLSRKKLAVNKITYATASVRRLLKYSNQGFTACSGCLSDVLQSVVENPELIHREVQYVD